MANGVESMMAGSAPSCSSNSNQHQYQRSPATLINNLHSQPHQGMHQHSSSSLNGRGRSDVQKRIQRIRLRHDQQVEIRRLQEAPSPTINSNLNNNATVAHVDYLLNEAKGDTYSEKSRLREQIRQGNRARANVIQEAWDTIRMKEQQHQEQYSVHSAVPFQRTESLPLKLAIAEDEKKDESPFRHEENAAADPSAPLLRRDMTHVANESDRLLFEPPSIVSSVVEAALRTQGLEELLQVQSKRNDSSRAVGAPERALSPSSVSTKVTLKRANGHEHAALEAPGSIRHPVNSPTRPETPKSTRAPTVVTTTAATTTASTSATSQRLTLGIIPALSSLSSSLSVTESLKEVDPSPEQQIRIPHWAQVSQPTSPITVAMSPFLDGKHRRTRSANKSSSRGKNQEPQGIVASANNQSHYPIENEVATDCILYPHYQAHSSGSSGGNHRLRTTILVHEVVLGSWTWCTCWSPDGRHLAIATDRNGFVIINTATSSVWRLEHDSRSSMEKQQQQSQKQPPPSLSTFSPMSRRSAKAPQQQHPVSIRAIAWGSRFIAIGGDNEKVSVLAPMKPYPTLHTFQVGQIQSLDWKGDSSTVLAIASHNDYCLIVNISSADASGRKGHSGLAARQIVSSEVQRLPTKAWTNAVAFSPSGNVLAVADQSGVVGIYSYHPGPRTPFYQTTEIRMEAPTIALKWSSDFFLFAGGQDSLVTMVDTRTWKKVLKMERDQTVSFISVSNQGNHLTLGGKDHVSLLSIVPNGSSRSWRSILSIGLKGMLPMTAAWHPKDEFLAVGGQDETLSAIQMTNHRQGPVMQWTFAVMTELVFAPNGKIVAVGSASGVTSFHPCGFRIENADDESPISSFELVHGCEGAQAIAWSAEGDFAVVGTNNSITIVGNSIPSHQRVTIPQRKSSFSVQAVIEGVDTKVVHDVAVHKDTRYLAVAGKELRILDKFQNWSCVCQLAPQRYGSLTKCSWSTNGRFLAIVGESRELTIYDTSKPDVTLWRRLFTIDQVKPILALSWGPVIRDSQYVAFGGKDEKITILEIRAHGEVTWEEVLVIPRISTIRRLDWSNASGHLAATIGDGTVSIVDLAHLKSFGSINHQMNITWQRQALMCSTEIRRNHLGQGNSLLVAGWLPTEAKRRDGNEDCILAVGGRDGVVEFIDMSEAEDYSF